MSRYIISESSPSKTFDMHFAVCVFPRPLPPRSKKDPMGFDSLDRPMNLQGTDLPRQTIVDDDVWVGIKCVIMPGVYISKGSIISAGTVLTKDTEPYGIYAGIPGKLIKRRKIN